MTSFVPIPTTRATGLYTRTLLLQQLQSDQLDLFTLQNQLSTGRRINLPSDDASSALRAITLQGLIERKSQIETNLNSGLSYLSATDAALNDVASMLADVRGGALGVAGTTASEEERLAVVEDVDATLEAILAMANATYQGRYLFSGSAADVRPYEQSGDSIIYLGNESLIQTYSNLDVLFATNIPGTEVFGGISGEVVGTADLNPQVTEDTLLSSLRGGSGISSNGALAVSDGANVSVIDISRAVTVGDVARLIEENAPAGRKITVDITGEGLTLRYPSSYSGNTGATLIITEVGEGRTALELGILETTGVAAGIDLVGDDLDPVVTLNTELTDLLGTRARAELVASGANNDISLVASRNGASLSGVTVQYVNDELLAASAGLTVGNEFAYYSASAMQARAALPISGANNDLLIVADSAGTLYNNVAITIVDGGDIHNTANATYVDTGTTRTLTIEIDDTGETTIQAIIDSLASTPFSAIQDTSVESGPLDTADTVDLADFVTNPQPNTGNSGGDAKTLYVYVDPGATTADDVVEAINAEGTFYAELDPQDSTSTSLAGKGLINVDDTATTSGGTGSDLDLTSGLQVVNGGETYTIDTGSAVTVQDLLNVLNGADAGIVAEIGSDGASISVRSRLSGGVFQIGENGGQLATQLGIRTLTEETKLKTLNYGTGVEVNEARSFSFGLNEIQIDTGDGQTFNITLPADPIAITLNDVVNAINAVTTTSVTAQPDGSGGIELIDNTVGTGELSVSITGDPLATSFEGSLAPVDFSVTDRNGQGYNVSLEGAETIGDVIGAINAATGGIAGGALYARLATSGNGIELVDITGGANDLTVTQPNGSHAAEQLGLVAAGESTATATTPVLTGSDQNFLQTDSVFTSLLNLRNALEANDTEAIGRAIEQLDDDINRVTFARAETGARAEGLELSLTSLEDESVQLRSALSDELDVDFAQAVSDLTARQLAYQASLRTMANILSVSLLNYI